MFYALFYFKIYRRRELGRDGFGKKIFSEDLKIEKDESEKKTYLIFYLRKFTYFFLTYFYLPPLLSHSQYFYYYLFIYLFIHSFIYLLIYLVIYSFVYSFINLIIYLFIYVII